MEPDTLPIMQPLVREQLDQLASRPLCQPDFPVRDVSLGLSIRKRASSPLLRSYSRLYENKLTSLPDSIFSDLTALTYLY